MGKLTWRNALLATGLVIVVDLLIAYFAVSQHTNKYVTQHEGDPFHRVFIDILVAPFVYLWCGIIDHPEVVTALATVAIGVYTYVLADGTKALALLAQKQEEAIRTHERAYILCGGPFGKPKWSIAKLIFGGSNLFPKARDFTGPWRLVIHNHGRTPAFVTKIKWGLCRYGEFRQDIPVSEIVEHPDIWLPVDRIFESPKNVDEAFPPSVDPFVTRHVEFPRERHHFVGWVFFGRVDYNDVFGKPHHSTFKMLILDDHSDPLPGCHSQDKS